MIGCLVLVLLLAPAYAVTEAELDKDYTGSVSVNQTDEYDFSLNETSVQEYVIRVHVLNRQPQKNSPLLIVIKQQQHVLSFEVPAIVNEIISHSNVSRTLCPISVTPDKIATLIIGISSFTSEPIPYMVRAEWVRNFDLKLKETRGFQVYPAQPMLLRYQFTQDLDSVAVRIVSPDDVCMTLSIQPMQCPWESGTRFGREQGPYQTVTSLGVISINKLQYEDGFFVLLTLEPTDYICKGIEKLIPIPTVEIYRRIEPNNRTKAVTVTLQPTPNRWFYIFPVFGAITFFLLFYVAAILILCIYDRYEKRRFALVRCQADLFVESSSTRTVYGSMSTRQPISSRTPTHSLFPNIPDSSAQPDQTHCMARSWHSDETETRPQRRLSIAGSVSPLPHSADSECALTVPVHGSRSCELYPSPPEPANPVLIENQPSPTAMPGDEQEADFIGDSTTAIQPKSSKPPRPSKTRRRIPKFARPTSCVTRPFDHPSSGDEEPTTEFHSDLGSNVPPPNANRSTTIPSLIDLSRKPYTQLNRKYLLYFWFLIIVSIFYGLPAVQLIMIYQKTLIETGNEDLCYYNFECARPLGIFTAFNNIISNVGYVMLGLLFLALTARRDLIHRRALKLRPAQTQTRGVPQHYGLYYSMGLALTMEGIMSACYHMCPSFSNFQFDTAYMYILAMLIMLKIYQTRHPDVNATAHSAYMVMAVVIFLGVTGVIYGSETFWIAFTVFFLLMSVVLTAEIYYMGHWNIDLCLPRRLYSLIQSDGIHCLRPMYLERMLLLLIANVINFALAGYGIVARPRNFSSFLLTIFMVNMLVYTMFYILMKLRNRERFLPLPVVFMLFAIVSWTVSIYFFFSRLTTWEVTPAQSRALNQPCLLLSFYDAHDIWHFMSAISMFFSFLMLMNLDDDLADHPRDQIPVF